MEKNYTEFNSHCIDRWVAGGWEWGGPISREAFERARAGEWEVFLTPTRPVPRDWFCPMKGAKILGLASGGGQQMPVFCALGAECTVLDYSQAQLETERMVAQREGYDITVVRADMTRPLPFPEESFDLIFHPVSNCYVEEVLPIWRECARVLKRGGLLLSGLDNGINFAFDDGETRLEHRLPYNPLKDRVLYEEAVEKYACFQFSPTIEEQVGGQLKAGLLLQDIYQDTNGYGNLHDFGVPTFFAAKALKP